MLASCPTIREPVQRPGRRTHLQPRAFDADISRASKLWLIIADTGSNAPERVLPVFVQAEFVGPAGVVPLSSLTPLDGSGCVRPPRPRGGCR